MKYVQNLINEINQFHHWSLGRGELEKIAKEVLTLQEKCKYPYVSNIDISILNFI